MRLLRNNPVVFTQCDCSDPAHIMLFSLHFEDSGDVPREEPVLYVEVQLNPQHPWWKRAWYAWLYVLGKRSRFTFGHWDEGTISVASAKELLPLLGRFISEHNNWEAGTRTVSQGDYYDNRTG